MEKSRNILLKIIDIFFDSAVWVMQESFSRRMTFCLLSKMRRPIFQDLTHLSYRLQKRFHSFFSSKNQGVPERGEPASLR
ncbi:MAG: hypothetical protein A2W17_04365 [Planctomycetes bacterium RBG_16_41_13]|nr:MAG: hypothetical protein A2W17_04365 [Planctomycetes bacterium RBG_16_41_13]